MKSLQCKVGLETRPKTEEHPESSHPSEMHTVTPTGSAFTRDFLPGTNRNGIGKETSLKCSEFFQYKNIKNGFINMAQMV